MEILYTTIDKLFIKEKNEDGTPLVNQTGEQYKQVRIKVPEYGEKVLSHYVGKNSQYPSREMDMVAGEMYWIKIEEKGKFLNFKLASETDKLLKRIEDLENAVYKKEKSLITKKDLKTAEEQPFESDFIEPSDIDMSQIPF